MIDLSAAEGETPAEADVATNQATVGESFGASTTESFFFGV
jgi:hypothetical protein